MLSAYEAVRETQKATIKGDFETGWRKALHDGWIADTAYAAGGAGEPDGDGHRLPTPAAKRCARDHLPARSECV